MKNNKVGFHFLQGAAISITAILLLMVIFFAGSTESITTIENRPAQGCIQVQEFSHIETEQNNAPVGIVEEYGFKVPGNLQSDTYLYFYLQQQFVNVYLDGVSIYRLMPSGNSQIIKTPGCNWVGIFLGRRKKWSAVTHVIDKSIGLF